MTKIIDDRFGKFEIIDAMHGFILGKKLDGMSDEETIEELRLTFGDGFYEKAAKGGFIYTPQKSS